MPRRILLAAASAFVLGIPGNACAQYMYGPDQSQLYQAAKGVEDMKKPLFEPELPAAAKADANRKRDFSTAPMKPVKWGEKAPWEKGSWMGDATPKEEEEKRAKESAEQNKQYRKAVNDEQYKQERTKKVEAMSGQKELREAELQRELFTAIYTGDLAKVRRSFAAGADPNMLYKEYTPFHYAAALRKTNILLLLLDNPKVDIGNEENQYYTLLHWAAYENHFDLVRKLVEHGANPNVRDDRNRTPYYYAKAQGNKEITDFLFDRTEKFDRAPQPKKP